MTSHHSPEEQSMVPPRTLRTTAINCVNATIQKITFHIQEKPSGFPQENANNPTNGTTSIARRIKNNIVTPGEIPTHRNSNSGERAIHKNATRIIPRNAPLYILQKYFIVASFSLRTSALPPRVRHRVETLGVTRNYFTVTAIFFGFTSSAFGAVIVRMPFSYDAAALSPSTFIGRIIDRENSPRLISLR